MEFGIFNNSALISNDSLSYKINKNETLENDYFSFNLKMILCIQKIRIYYT